MCICVYVYMYINIYNITICISQLIFHHVAINCLVLPPPFSVPPVAPWRPLRFRVQVWADGTRYRGQWYHDLPHGHGKLEQVLEIIAMAIFGAGDI